MTAKTFRKILSANDAGTTGGHQSGILVPKTEWELLEFLPRLDPSVKNPDAHMFCMDEDGNGRHFRYVYYNNRLHDEKGTRNEYRITRMTRFFRDVGARAGDAIELSRDAGDESYRIRIIRSASVEGEGAIRIKLTGWRRIH